MIETTFLCDIFFTDNEDCARVSIEREAPLLPIKSRIEFPVDDRGTTKTFFVQHYTLTVENDLECELDANEGEVILFDGETEEVLKQLEKAGWSVLE